MGHLIQIDAPGFWIELMTDSFNDYCSCFVSVPCYVTLAYCIVVVNWGDCHLHLGCFTSALLLDIETL